MVDRDRIADPQPDPRPALRALHEDLARAGIRLVLVPVPDKAAVEGRRLTRGAGSLGGVPGNPDWPRFVSEMRAAGVEVFDVPPPPVTPPRIWCRTRTGPRSTCSRLQRRLPVT